MATLQKFKHLATQCAVSPSPTSPSPTNSPVIHLRRRKTLRMLLSRTSSDHHGHQFRRRLPRREPDDPPEKKVRRKLRDLLVSSPPPDEEDRREKGRGEGGGIGAVSPASAVPGGFGRKRGLRPISSTFRYRLLRRAWRPMLVTIPE